MELVMMVLLTLSGFNLLKTKAASESDEIVAMDLLTVKEPNSEAESRLRVIRLKTRSGAKGYGDYLALDPSGGNEEAILARLVNRYAEQNHKKDIFLTDPSIRALGAGHPVIGQTASDVIHAKTDEWPGRALYHREGFGPIWQGRGKSALVIALQTALLDLAEEKGPSKVRLCPSIPIGQMQDGEQHLRTPEEIHHAVALLKQAGFTAVRLELAGSLDIEMKSRGECPPYRYPQELLGQIDQLVLASKNAAGPDMDVTVAANLNLSTDGMTYLALHCQRNKVTLLENPMAIRHLLEQGEARKEFSQPLGFGGDYHSLEDFAQGIKHEVGTVLVPDAGYIGGVTMLTHLALQAREVELEMAPVVQGGPFSLLAVARGLYGNDKVLWLSSPYQDEWIKEDGLLKVPLRMEQGELVMESCEFDETKFHVKAIIESQIKPQEK